MTNEGTLRIFSEPQTIISREVRNRSVKSFLDLIILTILAGGPTHGYDIIAKIHRNLHVFLSAGQVYPKFSCLERDGLIKIQITRRKKILSITSKGIAKCHEMLKETIEIPHILFHFLLLSEMNKEPNYFTTIETPEVSDYTIHLDSLQLEQVRNQKYKKGQDT